MKTTIPQPLTSGNQAFTLIEMVGVLAIMAILAAVIAPNALRTIERAATNAEADSLRALDDQVKQYLRDTANVPTAANWNTVLAPYASLSPADLLTNRRQMTRVFVPDPIVANQRAMFISSMRTGVALGPAATAAAFAAVWNWDTNNLAASPPPVGWNAWNKDNIEFLVIERVNLTSVYRTDLQSLTLTLNNKGSVPVSYNLVLADGTIQPWVDIAVGATATLANRHPKDRLNLYRAAGGMNLDYSYVVSTSGKTFDFKDAIYWLPQ